MKKNILLSTIYKADNYGAIFQAYSLKELLKNNNNNKVILLNEIPKKISKQYSSLRTNSIKAFIKDILRFPYRFSMLKKFDFFIKSNFLELKRNQLPNIDLCVTGSDQVWNPEIISSHSKLESIYFFKDIESPKKIAFSASLGSHRYTEEQLNEFCNLVSDYQFISVRENDTAEYLTTLLDKKILNTLDPTLLQQESFWHDLIKTKTKTKSAIVVYYNNKSKRLDLVSNSIKKYKSQNIHVINNWYNKEINSDKYIRNAGPLDFLSEFNQSSAVITNTFHGVCFAINFKKDFLYINDGGHSNRVESLLAKVGGEHKIISSDNIDPALLMNKLTQPIDYELLNKEIKDSLKLLNEFI